jgi:hypothetical protein
MPFFSSGKQKNVYVIWDAQAKLLLLEMSCIQTSCLKKKLPTQTLPAGYPFKACLKILNWCNNEEIYNMQKPI